ncbi:Diguanylate cyclase protein [Salinisphaera shabanensis E1L3A]|uniref:Diguanylate cyclase protein n=1 Tax=Salinisphaera shabanensis E1L3A TaxID=1033802 RepID=U2ERZ6_9GAMM|nr:response regulator transcription factor [Salinisphaera shabanensis]ERJ20767.1 Diguanylate cyclase protein [Salinisphaera shabanensis E1L3A]
MNLAYDNRDRSMAETAPLVRGVVLVVDDQPETLALLSEVLGNEGYTVIVAVDGRSALERARMITPDLVLLDARMPGMDGFEVCLRMSADASLAGVPVIFMTGLTESEHIVKGFRAGGADYVTKPVKPDEVCVRVEAHLKRAQAQRRADMVVNAGGRAAIIADSDGQVRWHSSRAAAYLERYLDGDQPGVLPGALVRWMRQAEPSSRPYEIAQGQARLSIRLAGPAGADGWILTLVEFDDEASINDFVERFELTPRQAEVLLWVSRGKTNRDIGEILDMKPRTVNKHLEHIFPKLGVETRAAAAATALQVIGP